MNGRAIAEAIIIAALAVCAVILEVNGKDSRFVWFLILVVLIFR